MSNNPPLTAKQLLPELGKTEGEVILNFCRIFRQSGIRMRPNHRGFSVDIETYKWGKIVACIVIRSGHAGEDGAVFFAFQRADARSVDFWDVQYAIRDPSRLSLLSRMIVDRTVLSRRQLRTMNELIDGVNPPSTNATAEWIPQTDKSVEMFTKLNARIKELEESLRLRDLALDDAYRQLKEMSKKLKCSHPAP